MSFYLCICCDLCNQQGFVNAPAHERRTIERKKGGRRQADGRESLRIKSEEAERLVKLLSSSRVLGDFLDENKWHINQYKLHFCESCYERHQDKITDMEKSQFQLALIIAQDCDLAFELMI